MKLNAIEIQCDRIIGTMLGGSVDELPNGVCLNQEYRVIVEYQNRAMAACFKAGLCLNTYFMFTELTRVSGNSWKCTIQLILKRELKRDDISITYDRYMYTCSGVFSTFELSPFCGNGKGKLAYLDADSRTTIDTIESHVKFPQKLSIQCVGRIFQDPVKLEELSCTREFVKPGTNKNISKYVGYDAVMNNYFLESVLRKEVLLEFVSAGETNLCIGDCKYEYKQLFDSFILEIYDVLMSCKLIPSESLSDGKLASITLEFPDADFTSLCFTLKKISAPIQTS